MTAIDDDVARAAARVRSALGPVAGLAVVGSGLDFCVFRGHIPEYGAVAIRTPRARIFDNHNDRKLDSRDLLEQEAAMARHARAHRLPAPRVHDLVRHDQGDLLISEYVDGDGSTVDGAELGGLVRRLHDAPLPAAPALPRAADVLIERIARRGRAVEHLAGLDLRLPAPERLADALPLEGRSSLLHMDLRPDNLLARGGAVAALVDWANALIGPPLLELARIAEYGALDDRFVSGYGLEPGAAAGPAWLLYQLDTAVMLAVVFLSEAPDGVRAATQLRRIRTLADDLRSRS
jgi:aminoglycoside phosphotransferase (APT) family kinase protein